VKPPPLLPRRKNLELKINFGPLLKGGQPHLPEIIEPRKRSHQK